MYRSDKIRALERARRVEKELQETKADAEKYRKAKKLGLL